jgi:hypothetical protein
MPDPEGEAAGLLAVALVAKREAVEDHAHAAIPASG